MCVWLPTKPEQHFKGKGPEAQGSGMSLQSHPIGAAGETRTHVCLGSSHLTPASPRDRRGRGGWWGQG